MLDFDDVGAKLAQYRRGKRRGGEGREIEHADAVQGSGHGVSIGRIHLR